MNRIDRRLVLGGALCGIFGLLIYIGLAVFFSDTPGSTAAYLRHVATQPHAVLGHILFAGAAALWAVAFLGLGKLLAQGGFPNAARIGTVLGIVACGITATMIIAQGSVMVRMGQQFVAASTDSQRDTIIMVYRGIRAIDQGMDLAFDLFFFSGWICFGVAMFRHRGFGKIFGALVIIPFVIDAPIQLWYAPTPPPFDIGPFASFILFAAYIQAVRVIRRIPLSEVLSGKNKAAQFELTQT